ncbi:MAG: DUF932 domain-containing protein [Nitrospiraceae bacterium]|nr:DUF932 domain-containing protein [Nitrospiraceae bacterium]
MSESTLIAYDRKITREELALVPTPERTTTHQTIPHIEVVESLIETLGFRHIAVVSDEYAVDRTGSKMFGLMVLDQGMPEGSFALGIRNSHDKSFRLSITVGYQVFVCQNMAFKGDFEPVLAKHSKNFSLQNSLSIGVDSIQRNFKPMVAAVERWQQSQLSDVAAKLLIYNAFVEGSLEVPRYLDRVVHEYYFNSAFHFGDAFGSRTMWSLSNAFTSAFKELDPIPQFKATGKLAGFLQKVGG